MPHVGTTINIDPRIRDRLKRYGTAGMTYNDILKRLMDRVDRDDFFAEAKRIAQDPASEEWVALEDL